MEATVAQLPELDAAGFADAIKAEGTPVLVEYVADHCIWCERLEPILTATVEKYQARLRIVKVNVQRYPQTAPAGGVRATPTLALYRGGRLIMSKSGMMQRAQLVSFLDHWLDPTNEGLSGA